MLLDRGPALAPLPPSALRSRLLRQAIGDAVQPAAHRFGATQRSRFAAEDEKDGLKSILGVVGIVQDTLTDAQHHRSMPPHQRRESVLIAPGGEALDQFAVRQAFRPRGGREGTKILPQQMGRFARHDRTSSAGRWIALFSYCPKGWGAADFFSAGGSSGWGETMPVLPSRERRGGGTGRPTAHRIGSVSGPGGSGRRGLFGPEHRVPLRATGRIVQDHAACQTSPLRIKS